MNITNATKETKVLEVKIGRKKTQEKDRDVEAAVAKFISVKAKIEELNEKLNETKVVLIAKGRKVLGEDDAATITFGVDDDRVQVKFDYEIKVSDSVKLKSILGVRFDDLVRTKTEYTPVKKLKEMASKNESILKCIDVKEKSPSCTVVK